MLGQARAHVLWSALVFKALPTDRCRQATPWNLTQLFKEWKQFSLERKLSNNLIAEGPDQQESLIMLILFLYIYFQL